MSDLPVPWQRAFERDHDASATLADPLPARRLGRLLAGFLFAGFVYLGLPGTTVGAWYLILPSLIGKFASLPPVAIQSHAQALLFGWAGSFLIGMTLFAVEKLRGGRIRSIGLGWVMLALWFMAVGTRWTSAVWHIASWRIWWNFAALIELAVGLLLIWQCTAGVRRRPSGPNAWSMVLIWTGLAGFVVTLALQCWASLRATTAPVFAPGDNALLLATALWGFCFPIAWGFCSRYLPSLLGLRANGTISGRIGLTVLVAGLVFQHARVSPASIVIAVAFACRSLRIFERAERPPKVTKGDAFYPWYTRLSFVWLAVSALLMLPGDVRGFTDASRHAFTLGFFATLFLSAGSRVLPSFLNGRKLWSLRLMHFTLILHTAALVWRIASELLIYVAGWPPLWFGLPLAGFLSVAAMGLFALNLVSTIALPAPAHLAESSVNKNLSLYWCVASYPSTRGMLIEAGLRTLATAPEIPRTLTLDEAAAADGVNVRALIDRLRAYFNTGVED